MPHSPPVPPGNTSPYPPVETPHHNAEIPTLETSGSSEPDSPVLKGTSKEEGQRVTAESSSRGRLAIILAVGALGALVAGLVAFTRSGDAADSPGEKAEHSKS